MELTVGSALSEPHRVQRVALIFFFVVCGGLLPSMAVDLFVEYSCLG
jgi:hypothetical protein